MTRCGFAVFSLHASWSVTIFNRFKIGEFLSETEDVLNGLIKQFDEDDFLLFHCFCFFRSLATSAIISILILLVFTSVQYGFSSDNLNERVKVSGKVVEQSQGFISFPRSSDCSFRILQTNFATGRTNQKDFYAHRANTSMNVVDCVERAILRWNSSSGASFCAISVKTPFMN